MRWWMWVLLVLLLIFGWYLSSTAGRLDRLHRRVDAGKVSLDRALLERATVSTEIGAALLPDPASALVIADAAHDVRHLKSADDFERGQAESNLSQVLAAAFRDSEDVSECRSVPGGDALMQELDSATRRVELSRRFLNDAVRACRDVRYQFLVRLFRLAGHTPWPQPFEMNDIPPAGFGIR